MLYVVCSPRERELSKRSVCIANLTICEKSENEGYISYVQLARYVGEALERLRFMFLFLFSVSIMLAFHVNVVAVECHKKGFFLFLAALLLYKLQFFSSLLHLSMHKRELWRGDRLCLGLRERKLIILVSQ